MAPDPVLPALDQALDPDLMLPLVAQAAGLPAHEAAGFTCSLHVLSHKPGRRCTIRYTLVRSTGPEGCPIPSVVAKLYSSRRRALRSYERMHRLGSSQAGGCGVPCIPACLGPVPSLALFFQECVAGTELDHVASSAEATPFVLAAQWLLRLHASPRLEGLREMSYQHALEKVDAWCADIEARLPRPAATGLRPARDALHELASAHPSYSPSMIHRDYYHAQVLWTGEGIWVLDFDELCVGDPALDVGHFLAHLAYKAHLMPVRADAFADCADAFLRTYRKAASLDPEPRLSFHTAYTFLKLAHTEVVRGRTEWRRRAEVLLEFARHELEPSLRRETG
jgi:aminoglycoside phosphotransferase (APT) family kinase protein